MLTDTEQLNEEYTRLVAHIVGLRIQLLFDGSDPMRALLAETEDQISRVRAALREQEKRERGWCR